jgi:hypothetical protein
MIVRRVLSQQRGAIVEGLGGLLISSQKRTFLGQTLPEIVEGKSSEVGDICTTPRKGKGPQRTLLTTAAVKNIDPDEVVDRVPAVSS